MGTDIHSFIERWEPNVGWQWLKGDLFENDRGYDEPWEPITGRWYHLFGFLAGVRDHDVEQIAECRGLPSDMCPELRKEFGFVFPDDCPHAERDRYGMRMCGCAYHDSGHHSHSWLTGAELIAFDYTKPMRAYPETMGGVLVDAGGPTTVGEYIGLGYVQRFHEIAALAENPVHVRMVYAFDS